MLKELALLAGGIYIASKLSKSEEGNDGVIPSTNYTDVRSMEPVDYDQVWNRLVNMTSSILDPVRRREMIDQVQMWIDAGLGELEIRQRIQEGISLIERVGGEVGGIITIDDPVLGNVEPTLNTTLPVEDTVVPEAPLLTEDEVNNLIGRYETEAGIPLPYGAQAMQDIRTAIAYGFDPFASKDPMLTNAMQRQMLDQYRW